MPALPNQGTKPYYSGLSSFLGTSLDTNTGELHRDALDPLRGTIYNLKRFGDTVVGEGEDVTTAIDAWWAAGLDDANVSAADVSSIYRLNRTVLELPPGDFTYAGLGLAINEATQLKEFVIRGAGPEATRITLADAIWLINASADMDKFTFENIQVQGGAGAIRFTSTQNNVRNFAQVRNCIFHDYTVCAIGHLAPDFPYWRIERCIFDGRYAANAYTSIGIYLSGIANGSVIDGCEFHRNKYGIKLANGGNDLYLSRSSFLRFDGSGRTSPATDIWLLPGLDASVGNSAGAGTVIRDTKFGNENVLNGDYHVLIASEDAGSGTDGMQRSHDTSTVTGISRGWALVDCAYYGNDSQTVPLVYSVCDDVRDYKINGVMGGSMLPYVIQFLNATPAGTSVDHRTARRGVVGPFLTYTHGFESVGPLLSNRRGVAVIDDPYGIFADDPDFVLPPGGRPTAEFKNHSPATMAAFSNTGTMTRSAATDAMGGTNAQLINASTAGLVYHIITAPTTGIPIWIEFDLKTPGSGTPLTSAKVHVRHTAGTPVQEQRVYRLPAAWKTFRFQVDPRDTTNLYFVLDIPGAGAVEMGRPRIYQDRSPVALPETVTFAAGDTTPSVKAGSGAYATANSGATSITTFDDGTDGQRISVKIDANTTLVHGATLVLAGATNITGTASDVVDLVRMGTVWYQAGISLNG